MVGTSKPKNRPMGVKDDSGNIGPYQATEFPPSPCTDRVAVRPDRAKSLLFGKRDERESFGSQTDALLDHVARKLVSSPILVRLIRSCSRLRSYGRRIRQRKLRSCKPRRSPMRRSGWKSILSRVSDLIPSLIGKDF